MKGLPILVSKLVHFHEAWIVGSAAMHDADFGKAKDFDVLVPYANWPQAAQLIPQSDSVTPNRFGGWKCLSDGRAVDVWPGDLGYLITCGGFKAAWHPKSGIRLVIIKDL